MKWLRENWKRVAKWGGLGAGCVVIALLAFVGARWVAAGSEYEGELSDLAPAGVTTVVVIDNVPARKLQIEAFLDALANEPATGNLASASWWREGMGKSIGPLDELREQKLNPAIADARKGVEQAGGTLFEDVLGGELIFCSDAGSEAAQRPTEYVALLRVGRGLRFRWQFLDIAQAFFPEGANQPTLDYEGGILTITPVATPGKPAPATIYVTLLDDVLVAGNSSRLLNESIRLHSSGEKGIYADERFVRTQKLVELEARQRHAVQIWLDLDRMRERLPDKEVDGQMVNPVDSFNSLPVSVVSIYPDIFTPVDRMVRADLDTRPFTAAYYGFDLSDAALPTFDQYLLADPERLKRDEFKHLAATWQQPPAQSTQLGLLPTDLLFQVSYRQPLEVLYTQVFDDAARSSLVGDFIVALRGDSMKAATPKPCEEFVFAAAPRRYAPGASIPISGTDFPLPAFWLGFRVPGASAAAPQALLEEYLAAQRGRARKPEDGEAPRPGIVSVVEMNVAGARVWGFHDPREEDNFVKRLNLSIRAALIGEWLVLCNSESLLAFSIRAQQGLEQPLDDAPGSAWNYLRGVSSATIHVNFGNFVDYALSPQLFKVLRDNKFNTGLIDGRDPGEVRREIATSLGLNPTNPDHLRDERVSREYNDRKAAWLRICMEEGNRYESELQSDLNGLRFFRDMALETRFAPDHLHVRGIVRFGR